MFNKLKGITAPDVFEPAQQSVDPNADPAIGGVDWDIHGKDVAENPVRDGVVGIRKREIKDILLDRLGSDYGG